MDSKLRKDQVIQLISCIYPQIYYNDSVVRIDRPFNKSFN